MQSDCEESLIKHSFHCSLFKQLHEETAKRTELKKIETLEVSKSIFVAANLDYFDSTLLCDIQEFDLYHETASFCQHLQNIRINYRERELLSLLFEFFRDSALS